ncbi:MAG: thioredoxin-disulfide reductase [Clostridia bacterium]|nr:thioredoxin-disulfide reductase [Oscillospiraceae bacterium]MBR4893468.1 thioredoxin-disulfide reductase [Clostridia bacterium]
MIVDKIYDIIIIGGGPAGYTAALYSARAGFDTLVIERMSAGGQMTLTGDIDNYPGFDEGIDGFTLGMKMQSSAERFGAKTVYKDIIDVNLSEEIKEVKSSKETFFAKSVIIATGANPKELGIENEKDLIGLGVHYCAHCDGRFYKDKTVVVVGGGNSAVSDALYLSRLAKEVYVVHRRDTLRATKIYHEQLLKAKNVKFIWDSVVTEFIVSDKVDGIKVKNLKEDSISEILCDGVFVSIGRKPATGFLGDQLKLDDNGYILADESTKTSVDGVYAVGDVRTKELRQIVTAVADGAVAIHMAEEFLS